MSEYNFTIDWSKWSQAFHIVSAALVTVAVLFICYLLVIGKGYEQGKQDGFQVGSQQCTTARR